MNTNHQPQTAWKKNLVLLAKNAYVWLYQLTQRYKYPIQTLDQVPTAELEKIRDRGITGIWLIGIWERSPASKKIKSLYGFEDAAASAYSIYDYRIADDLGGRNSFREFREKAGSVGLRIGCDMVPNHTGIDSPWLIEHPEWYIKADHLPNNDWKYTSPDLSLDADTNIQIEDGYYNQTGAAEVFAYKKKGEQVKYIYHGNDGTSMPWNDTAQLNYLLKDVRQAVRRVILDVAAEFDIIRLDAAMTLTRRHFKRLWFPGDDGERCIPTREPYHMADEEFNACMPEEFWKQVVQDIQEKEPETLLVAEAFWLMEGYFIKQIGMDRVYNSAFMNMIKDEDNGQVKNCLRDLCRVTENALEHLVNYQTTPDEEPAINQFGKGDKYFGVCTLMSTLPGLPMFGHGQFEGLSERYGMDYLEPHMDETVDQDLVRKHKSLITPLLNRRELFSSSSGFEIRDVLENDKVVDDVIAFTNHSNQGIALVLFNNASTNNSGELSINDISNGCHNMQVKNIRENQPASRITFDDISGRIRLSLEPYEALVYLISFK